MLFRSEIRVNRIPQTREQAPYWGRFKRMNQATSDGQVPSLPAVLDYQPSLSGDVATYSWSWAACMLLTSYPEYRGTFIATARQGKETGPGFNRQLQTSLDRHWPILAARWRLACHELDFVLQRLKSWSAPVFSLYNQKELLYLSALPSRQGLVPTGATKKSNCKWRSRLRTH